MFFEISYFCRNSILVQTSATSAHKISGRGVSPLTLLLASRVEAMTTRQKIKEEEAQKQREIAEAEEFLDERRVIDGKERLWSAESQVMLRTLAVEENVANSQDAKTKKKWNPRYPVEAKAELERREAVEKEEEEIRKVEEEKRRAEEEEKSKREEVRKKLRRPGRPLLEGHGTGARRPLLKNTEEANAELERMEAPRSTNTERAVSPFEVYNPFESDEDEEQKSKKEFDPFDLPTTSESD